MQIIHKESYVIIVSWFLILIENSLQLPGIVQTLAGGGEQHQGKRTECNDEARSLDGVGSKARFNYPWAVVHDNRHDILYVADCACPESEHKNDRIRRIDVKTRKVTTLAGSTSGFSNGFGEEAHFSHVAGMTLDDEEDVLYLADSGNHRIRIIYVATRKVDTIAGLPSSGHADLSLVTSMFNNPQAVAYYKTAEGVRKLYVADTDNHAIRVITLENDMSGRVSTVSGGTKGFLDGESINAKFNHPTDLTIDKKEAVMYIADKHNNAIRRLDLTTYAVTTLAGKGFGTMHNLKGVPEHVTFFQPEGMVFDPDFRILYVVEFGSHQIRVVTLEGLVKTLAGQNKGFKNGVGKMAEFYHPTGLAYDRKTRMLYVTDQYNHLVRSITGVGSAVQLVDVVNKAKQKTPPPVVETSGSSWSRMTILGIIMLVVVLLVVKPCMKFVHSVVRNSSNNSQSNYTYSVMR